MPIRTTTKPAEPGECRIRIAAAGDVHYGRDIWTFAGTDRLGPDPRAQRRRRAARARPDLVLHGHARAGTFERRVGEVPIYNVSVPVRREDSGSSS